MGRAGISVFLRLWAVALVAAAFWFLAKYAYERPDVLPADAPATEFSAARADATLARILGPERPHPAATAENAAVRARIIGAFASLGVKASEYRGFGCNPARRYGVISCASVTDIIADVRPGAGKAIVLLAHYDSVPAGPGAADDASSVATILEAVRAMKARGAASLHPIIAVITDGEEYGLLGAAAFLDNRQFRARVGAVVNVEARGNRGPSLLFQTSPGDGRLIDLYAKNVKAYATSSLYAEIYRFLPNDTDLTIFLRDGLTGFNFAFVDNVAHYHTPLDRRENLSLATLQQHGENLLGVASGLEQTDFAALKGGNDIYVDVFGRVLPRMPASWALPLSIIVFLMMVVAVYRARGEAMSWRARGAAFAMPLALLAGTTLAGFGLHYLAQLISGTPDPSFAFPLSMRIALALCVWGVALLVMPMSAFRATAASVWLWFAGLGVVMAIFLPGFTPYFLFPSIVAAVLLLAVRDWNGQWGKIALLAAALPALALWIAFVAQGEALMGLKITPLFTAPATFGLFTLAPLMHARALTPRIWRTSLGAAFGGAVVAAVIAGLQPSYSEIAPLRLNINYVEDHAAKRAVWSADANAPLPQGLRAAAKFGADPEKPYAAAFAKTYVAPAGKMRFATPSATVTRDGKGRVMLKLQGSKDATLMYVVVPKAAQLIALSLNGKHFTAPPEWAALDQNIIACMTPDCAHTTLTLDLATKKAVTLTIVERRAGLPAFGKFLARARPKTAVPSQMGDGAFILAAVKIPAW